jgi:hypothetical protein
VIYRRRSGSIVNAATGGAAGSRVGRHRHPPTRASSRRRHVAGRRHTNGQATLTHVEMRRACDPPVSLLGAAVCPSTGTQLRSARSSAVWCSRSATSRSVVSAATAWARSSRNRTNARAPGTEVRRFGSDPPSAARRARLNQHDALHDVVDPFVPLGHEPDLFGQFPSANAPGNSHSRRLRSSSRHRDGLA